MMGLSDIKDTQCGFKFFRRDVAQDLFLRLKTNGFMFDVELLRAALKSGYRIKQFPVTWSNDPDTRYNLFTGSLKNIFELVGIRYGKRD
jgi:dolichyl-phosphate beta-glucosyltransferase